MKLKTILYEIGDSFSKPSNVKLNSSDIEFSVRNVIYLIEISKPIDYQNKIGIAIAFDVLEKEDTSEDPFVNQYDYSLTNQNNPLTLMGNIMWSVTEWMKKYHAGKELVYITYDPKNEPNKQTNSRDKMYRIFIEKYAKKNNSAVTFAAQGGIHSMFKPYIKIIN